MTWDNWTSIAGSVLDFFIGLVPRILDLAMSNPIMGVPIIVSIIGLILGLILRFIGSIGNKKSDES